MNPIRSTLYPLALLAVIACRTEPELNDIPQTCENEDELAGNSSRLTAAVLGFHFAVDGWDSFEGFVCSGDEDWFALDVYAGQMFEIGMTLDNNVGNLEMELLSAEGGLLATSTSTTNNESVRYVFTDDQRVFLRVFGNTNQTEGAYTISMSWAGGPCQRDALEPNDAGTNPHLLEPGNYTDLTVCYGEEDWYEIPVVDGQVVSMDLTYDPTAADLSARLWRRDSTGALAWVGGSGATPTGAGLVARVSGPGPYLAQVMRGADTTNASYDLDLAITGAACEPDAFEPNDTYFSATQVSGTTSFQGGTVCLGDQDWYQVHVNNGELLNLDLKFLQANGDLAMYLYELLPDGTLSMRAAADSTNDNETILYRPNYTGEYLVYVFPSRGTALGQYDLDIEVLGSACISDSFEPNNAPLDAATLTPGSYADMTLCVGDDDWYAFSAQNGQLIDAAIQFSGTGNDLALYLYRRNPDGTLSYRTGSDTLTPNESFVYPPFEDGDFLLRVLRSRGTTLATYSMDFDIRGQACLPDAFEPNNAAPEAMPIADGVYPGQTLCVGDADWYEVEAKNGQLIHVGLDFVHADNDLGVALYKLNDDGSLSSRAGSNSLSDGEQLYYRPYDDGKFLVYVYSTRGTRRGVYDLDISVNGQPCVADAFEPNNATFEASPITPGTYSQSLCVGDSDWYSIDVQNGQQLYAKAMNITPGEDIGISIYKQEPDGRIVGRASSNLLGSDDEIIYYQPYDSGTFLLYAYNTRGSTVSAYDLEVDVRGSVCVPDAGYEPNDTWEQATPITPGTYTDLSLCVGDGDWYAIEAGNGELLDIELTFSHAANDLAMTLYTENPYSPGLMGLVGADSLTDNEWLQYTPYLTQTYYLNVRRSRGTVTADYGLNIKKLRSTCTPDGFEPNDHWQQAVDFTAQVNSGAPTPLTLCSADIDYFDLGMATGGQVVTLDAVFTHADNDVDMYLYRLNDDGTITYLKGSASVTDNEQIVYTIPSTWGPTHLVGRTNLSRGTVIANYTLQASVQ